MQRIGVQDQVDLLAEAGNPVRAELRDDDVLAATQVHDDLVADRLDDLDRATDTRRALPRMDAVLTDVLGPHAEQHLATGMRPDAGSPALDHRHLEAAGREP